MTDTLVFRNAYNLSQQNLADLFGIPLRTIQNWDSRHCMPEYVWTMMNMTLIGTLRPDCSLSREEFNNDVHDQVLDRIEFVKSWR